MPKKDFKYQIIDKIAVLSEDGDTSKELNKVSFNDREPKYDIRNWTRTDGEEKMSKGITLTEEEMKVLKKTLAKMSF